MAWSSPTTVNGTQGLDSLLPYLSEVTNFWFGRMIMLAFFFIIYFGYTRVNAKDYIGAFAVSTYVCFVIGLFFWVINLISGLDFALIIGGTLIASVILFTQRKDV